MDGPRPGGLNPPAGGRIPDADSAVSRRGSNAAEDLRQIAESIRERGAARAAVFSTRDLVLDTEDSVNAHNNPCGCGDGNLMVPPFAPAVDESRRWVQAFAYGVAFQLERVVGREYAGFIQGGQGWACQLSAARARFDFATEMLPLWRNLHDLVMWAERECMRRGYYLSVGLGAGACELCSMCDTSKLCVLPYQARPSIEAIGIDVPETLARLRWQTGAATQGGWNLFLTGMVLAV